MEGEGRGHEIVGSATTGLRLTGFASLGTGIIFAIGAVAEMWPSFEAAGLCLIAAALAYGLLLNALLRR